MQSLGYLNSTQGAMSSYLNLALSLLLEVCCCSPPNKAQMWTQILINEDCPSRVSVKPVLISCSGPDQTLSQPYYCETERVWWAPLCRTRELLSSSRTHSHKEIPVPFSVHDLESRHSPWDKAVPALQTSTRNLHFKQLLQGSKSQVRNYPLLKHQLHLPRAGNKAQCFVQLSLCQLILSALNRLKLLLLSCPL